MAVSDATRAMSAERVREVGVLARRAADRAEAGEYVCSADIEENALVQRGFKVFIMPTSQSLTAREATAIAGFARSGGTVMADLRPGVLNSVLNPADPGLLDDLFGITRPDGMGSTVRLDLALPLNGVVYNLPDTHVDEGLRLASGAALGGTSQAPAVIRNSFGQGRGILLNVGLGNYYDAWRGEGSNVVDLRNTPWGEDVRGLVTELLAMSGVSSRLQTRSSDGEPLVGVESVFFGSTGNE